ncbi:MAG: 30S ribosomal protein S17 [Chloroflexi bacterium]|nr:30S ribosomal protein S17 [Chloroflexota bacterium]MCL5275639.1 30S ribosomal protein S17 [Chloroflexota bacterium]
MSMEKRRRLTGVVVSDKMAKTIVVRVDRSIRHPLYQKVVRRGKNFKAHDETNSAHEGDMVQIVESRPLSATKRWALEQILHKAGA